MQLTDKESGCKLGWLDTVAILTGCLLLCGRFGPNSGNFFFWRNVAVSCFFFAVFFTVLRFLLHAFVADKVLRRFLSTVAFVVLTVPHHMLGLDKFYLGERPMLDWRDASAPPSLLDWFPEAFTHLPAIPHEFTFFAVMLLTGTLLLIRLTGLATISMPRNLAISLWVLILLQTWLHLSMRSPYTYLPHFEEPAANHYFSHYFLLDGGKGAVNLDYGQFRHGEDLFLGANFNVNPLLSRTFPAYLVSHLGNFVPPFYVWIALNCTSWLLGALAIWYLAKSLYSERAATFASLLMGSAQGIIVYAAQPKPYATAIGGIAILAGLLHWFTRRPSFSWAHCVGVGGAFGLFLLCYEGHPWLLVLPLMGISTGADWKKVAAIAVTGLLIHQSFMFLTKTVLSMGFQGALAAGENPLSTIFDLIKHGSFVRLYRRTIDTFYSYPASLLHAFQLTAIMAAPLAFRLLKGRSKLFLLCLFLPGFLTFWMFELSKSFYTEFPRLVYSAYPAIYILGGAALATIHSGAIADRQSRLKACLAWGIVATNFVYLNIDVWGFPGIYFRWFYRNNTFYAS